MYDDLFDEKMQNKMRTYFLQEISQEGTYKKIIRDEIIDIGNTDFVAIVVEGKLKQSLCSAKGIEKILYILQPGEIYGEMDYFSCGKGNLITKTMEDSVISIIEHNKLEAILKQNPVAYRFFLHSVIRKFRIVMLQMADMVFNSALGKIADIILRLSSQQGKKIDDKIVIDISLTHQELADLIGCSRTTVTRGLNELKDKEIVIIKNKKIIVNNPEKLKCYIDPVF